MGAPLTMEVVLKLQDEMTAQMQKIRADVAKQLEDISASTQKTDSSLQGMVSSFSAAKMAVQAFVAALGVERLVAHYRAILDVEDSLSKLAQRTSVSVEALSGLRVAAQVNDLSMEDLANGIRHLNKAIDENDPALKRLGITSKDTNEAILQAADAFAKYADGAGKSAAANDVFGRGGDRWIPMLNQGSESIRRFIELADRMGLKISSETANAANTFNDTLKILGLYAEGAAGKLVNSLLPALQSVATAMVNAADKGGTLYAVLMGFAEANKQLWFGSFGESGTAIQKQQKYVEGLIQDIEDLKLTLNKLHTNPSFGDSLWLGDDQKLQNKIREKLITLQDAQKALDAMRATTAPDKKPEMPARPGKDKKEKDDELADLLKLIDAYSHYERQLQMALDLGHGATEEMKLRFELEKGNLVGLGEGLQEELLLLARKIDAEKELEQLFKEGQEARKEQEKEYELAVKEYEALEKKVKTMDDYVLGLARANYLARQSNQERERTIEQWRLEERLVGLDEDAIANYQKALHDLNSEAAALRQDSYIGAMRGLENYRDEAMRVSDQVESAFEGAFKGLEDVMVDFTTTGKLEFGRFAQSIIADIARIRIRSTLAGLLSGNNIEGDAFQGALAWTARAIFGGASSSGVGMMYAGGLSGTKDETMTLAQRMNLSEYFGYDLPERAAGGPVASGQAYLVGENGPEIMVPGNNGTIVPNGALGTQVVVNVIESPGNGGQMRRRNEGGNEMLDIFVEQIKGAVAGDIMRGNGPVPAAMERSYGLSRAPGTY